MLRDIAQEWVKSVLLTIVDHFYAAFMVREREKRYVNHVNDTIDFGYFGLKQGSAIDDLTFSQIHSMFSPYSVVWYDA